MSHGIISPLVSIHFLTRGPGRCKGKQDGGPPDFLVPDIVSLSFEYRYLSGYPGIARSRVPGWIMQTNK